MDFSQNPPPLEPDRLLPRKPESFNKAGPAAFQPPPPPPTSKIIRVLGGSVFVALLLVVGLVQFYGRNERLATVEKVLVQPSMLDSVSFSDIDPVYKRKNIFFFDSISFLPAGKETDQSISLSTDDYETLFTELSNDASIRIVTADLEDRFQDPLLVHTLTIYVKSRDRAGKSADSIVFQTLQFLVGSPYYRIAMRQAGGQQWVYFRHKQQLDSFLQKLQTP